MARFETKYNIGDEVTYTPMFNHTQKLGIISEEMHGTIVAIRITKAKIFYDILDDYHGVVFDKVDSAKVTEVVSVTKGD